MSGFPIFISFPCKEWREKYPRFGASCLVLWFGWSLRIWLSCLEKASKSRRSWSGRNEHHLPSFSSSIIFWVYVRMSSRSQKERTDLTGESMNHFRRNLHMLWPQNVGGYPGKGSSASVPLNIIGLVTHPTSVCPFLWCNHKCAPPLFSPFLYLGPDLTRHYLASTTPLMEYVLLIPWLKNFYNLFCFPFNFVFFNLVVLLFPFWICSEGSISLCF